MSKALFVVDPKLPVDPNADKTNPDHPENVIRKAMMMERQAAEDGAHDSKVAIREGFAATDSIVSKPFFAELLESIDARIRVAIFLLIAVIAIVAAVFTRFKPYDFERRIVCAVIAIGSLHYAVAAFK